MSTEKVNHRAIKLAKLYAKDDWRKGGQKFRTSLINTFIPLAELSLKWAAEEVEQQTKQLREERDKAVELLKFFMELTGRTDVLASSDTYHFIGNDVLPFLNQLNQQDEAGDTRHIG